MTLQEFKQLYRYGLEPGWPKKGGFARVYKAYYLKFKEEEIVALKIYTKLDDDKFSLYDEISNARKLKHPNICEYRDFEIIETINVHDGGKETEEVCIMEFCDGGTIDEYLLKNPQYLDKLLIDTLKGIKFLHEINPNSGKKVIIHRDIKPGNVLVKLMHQPDSNGTFIEYPTAKITDFGISKLIDNAVKVSSRVIGTLPYMAPEQLAPTNFGIDGKISEAVDIWSFGAMAYELITGKMLFEGINTQTEEIKIQRILNEDFNKRLEDVSGKYQKLLKCCLVREAGKRAKDYNKLIDIIEESTIELTKPFSRPVLDVNTKKNKQFSKKIKFNIGLSIILLISIYVIYSGMSNLKPFKNNSTGHYGFKNAFGVEVIRPIYEDARDFSDGLACVKFVGKWGYIDKHSSNVIDYRYDFPSDFEDGLAVVRIRMKGKEVFNPWQLKDFNVQETIRKNIDSSYKWGAINNIGEVIIPFKYDFLIGESLNNNKTFTAKYNGLYGEINRKGQEVVPFKYWRSECAGGWCDKIIFTDSTNNTITYDVKKQTILNK